MGASRACGAGPGYPGLRCRSGPACGGSKPLLSLALLKNGLLPFLSYKFFASQKTYKTIAAGLHAGLVK
jgi:hypothetical protein